MVVWAASGIGLPMALSLARVNGVRGMPVVLDESGDIACYYLGTDPSLPPISAPRRESTPEETSVELRLLEDAITAATTGVGKSRRLRRRRKTAAQTCGSPLLVCIPSCSHT